MQFLRTIQKPKNGTITIELPTELADEEVEVIVLPIRTSSETSISAPKLDGEVDDALYNQARQRFLNLDTSGFTQQQLDAYHQARERLIRGRKPNQPRILGLTGGIVKMSDDFNAPLPDEDLFYEGDPAAVDTEADA